MMTVKRNVVMMTAKRNVVILSGAKNLFKCSDFSADFVRKAVNLS